MGTWLISTGRNAQCLHIVGNCFRTPGIHYLQWIAVADPVPEDFYKKVCSLCFPRGYPFLDASPPEQVEAHMDSGMPADVANGNVSSSSDDSSAESSA